MLILLLLLLLLLLKEVRWVILVGSWATHLGTYSSQLTSPSDSFLSLGWHVFFPLGDDYSCDCHLHARTRANFEERHSQATVG